MSKNVFNFITYNFVLSDPCNHYSHNSVYMSISVTQINCNLTMQSTCIWSKATSKQIEQYQICLNNKLRAIDQLSSDYVCTYVYCTNTEHMNEILLHKDIPTTVVRLYFDSYSRGKARVGWNNTMSEYFSVSNGVKQGGVIS